jgi:hypothetical protein
MVAVVVWVLTQQQPYQVEQVALGYQVLAVAVQIQVALQQMPQVAQVVKV